MSITVLLRYRARRREGNALVAALVARLEERSTWFCGGGSSQVRLFQGVQQPEGVLALMDWDTRASYAAHMPSERIDGPEISALIVAPPESATFTRLASTERMDRVATAIACTLVTTPATATDAVQALLSGAAHPATTALPGFVFRYVYVDREVSERFLVVFGCQSVEMLHAGIRGLGQDLTQILQHLGATVDEFLGHSRAHVERLPGRSVPRTTLHPPRT